MSEIKNNLQFKDDKLHLEDEVVMKKVSGIPANQEDETGTINVDANININGTVNTPAATQEVTDNPEYLKVTTDAQGKILCGIKSDGTTYIPILDNPGIDSKLNEAIQEFNEKAQQIEDDIDAKLALYDEIFSCFDLIEDPEGRSEITTDSKGKIISYRDIDGVKHENAGIETDNANINHLNLTDTGMTEFQQALKDAGFQPGGSGDYTNDKEIEIPIPRVAASINFYCERMPTGKGQNIPATMEYNDKDGNYFKKPVILNSQGSSSLAFIRSDGQCGNIAFDINDGSSIKFGNWPSLDSFHIKKYWIDIFRGQCIVGYHLIEQMYQNRKERPYDYINKDNSTTYASGDVFKDYWTGALCHPDGFPIIVYWINSITNEKKCFGVYAFNLKKHRDVYYMKKNKPKNIILDGVLGTDTFWGTNIDWTEFEIRNPKSLKLIDGSKYDGDNPQEITGDSSVDANTATVKSYIERLSSSVTNLLSTKTKEEFEKYYLVAPFIDYFLQSQIVANVDGFRKNWIWCTWDGNLWTPTIYDEDSIFGTHWTSIFIDSSYINTLFGIYDPKSPASILNELYVTEIKNRYKELRDCGIFSVDNIMGLLNSWLNRIGYENIKKETELYTEVVSYRDGLSTVADSWEFLGYSEFADNYSPTTTYYENNEVVYKSLSFKSKEEQTGVEPFTPNAFNYSPSSLGYFNSPQRVKNWLIERISYLDSRYDYNQN